MGWYRKKKKSGYGGFPAYVSVAERREQAAAKIAALRKDGKNIQPVIIEDRIIAKTFWGMAWCDNLESYSDFANRLPRGRTYARNGSVIDLQITEGEINALVLGSSIYTIKISVKAMGAQKWQRLVTECVGKIDSLIELLQGKISKGLMQVIGNCDNGLFPHPKEVEFACSCLDWADMCKHVAAVLYGVGARIDQEPSDLFLLRGAEYAELVTQASILPIGIGVDSESNVAQGIKDDDLSALFGIDIDDGVSGKRVVHSMKERKQVIKKKTSPSKSVVTIKKTKGMATTSAKTKIESKDTSKKQKITTRPIKKIVAKSAR